MHTSQKYYTNNPLVHRDRRLASAGDWANSFSCVDVRPLIICRGPIRKEAMQVFTEMGIEHYGILLSEKDSIVYKHALAPELRTLTDPSRVHRVPDYSGVSKEERVQRINQIVGIAQDNNYNSIFAGYGFMAEDEDMVGAMEQAGLIFIGPCSKTVRGAGLKDEAKRTASQLGVSVTPGVDNVTSITLLKKCKDVKGLQALVKKRKLTVDPLLLDNKALTLEEKADAVLLASYAKGIDLYTVEEMVAQVVVCVTGMYRQYPGNRIRLKAIAGGGGKGQRILPAPAYYKGTSQAERVKQAVAKAPELVREILNEVKTTGVGDNKNILIELNIETTRHQEIQLIGNGEWSLSLGARDCSLQMHEQKLLEVSVTRSTLHESLAAARANRAHRDEIKTLRRDIATLAAMEEEAERFAVAVGLDSVSTFECIVDGDKHFFMEMNTRIQVEHRVTELCYALKFTNPANDTEYFVVESLVEAMVLLARHKQRLPKPSRIRRKNAAVEARLNATNQALAPHAGGVIHSWTHPLQDEIRDDQGICVHNPDTDVFMKYTLAGAYDSNIALILTHGDDRLDSYQRLANILRGTKIRGQDLATNLQFHYGLVHWFIGNNINARPTTRFILPYLTAVGLLKAEANQIDLNYALQQIKIGKAKNTDDKTMQAELVAVVDRKHTLLTRPIAILLHEPHILAGWLSANKQRFRVSVKKIDWLDNPIEVLADLYHFLNMDHKAGRAAANMIWDHDQHLLSDARAFYTELKRRLSTQKYPDLRKLLAAGVPPKGFSKSLWKKTQSAHCGYQSGMELLSVLPYLAHTTGFFELRVNNDLSINIPEKLLSTELQEDMRKVLAPPPAAKSDEILAASGGMYYAREAPGMDVFVNVGDHFDEGDPLYIVEVMKMFNKVYAPFAGTIDQVLVEGEGLVISKGQPLFKVTPDEQIVAVTPEQMHRRKRQRSEKFLARVL